MKGRLAHHKFQKNCFYLQKTIKYNLFSYRLSQKDDCFMCKRITLAAIALLASSPIFAANFFGFDSEQGDYIGGGKSLQVQELEGRFALSTNFGNGASISVNNGDYWSMDFAAANKERLHVGKYQNATRFPFQAADGHGLSISGAGRGCNQLTGEFEVLDVNYNANGQIDRFAATFEQHCEGKTPALRGSVAYNSDVSLPGADPVIRVSVDGILQQVNVAVGQPVTVNVQIVANGKKGNVAQHWAGFLGPRGNQWFNGAGWTFLNTPVSAKIDYLQNGSVNYTVTPTAAGAYLFEYAIDNAVSQSLKANHLGHLVLIAK
ncbi:hypothetical protein ACTSKR_13940 [Chitinibacteraceae bacterium HSL-7]